LGSFPKFGKTISSLIDSETRVGREQLRRRDFTEARLRLAQGGGTFRLIQLVHLGDKDVNPASRGIRPLDQTPILIS
jgi:hypothetical protein